MDIGKAFTYVFEDPNWVMKLIIGGVILLVGILFSWLIAIPLLVAYALLLGYTLLTTRNVAEGNPVPLPPWTDFGALFVRGLYALVGIIVYFLPVIILACFIGILTAVAGGGDGTGLGQGGNSSLGGIVGIVVTCLNCIVGLYSLVAGITLQAPLTRFAMSANQISLFWDFRGNFDFISKNLSNYIIALLISWVASFIAGFGLILCGVGIVFTLFWAMLVQAFMFGQVWRNQAYPAAPATPAAPVMP